MTLKRKHDNDSAVVVWDNKPMRKKAIYQDYKANRTSMNFGDQITDLKAILDCVKISQAEEIGEEADDVIASLADQASDPVFIVSRDKDLLQLVKDGKVIVIRPESKGYSYFDEEAVKKTFGVGPAELACFLAFRGDESDNIPGVFKARSEIIAGLSEKYKQPRSVYAALDSEKISDFQREQLKKYEQQVYVNWELINLQRNITPSIRLGSSNIDKVQGYLNKYQIKAISAEAMVSLFETKNGFQKRTGTPTPTVLMTSLF